MHALISASDDPGTIFVFLMTLMALISHSGKMFDLSRALGHIETMLQPSFLLDNSIKIDWDKCVHIAHVSMAQWTTKLSSDNTLEACIAAITATTSKLISGTLVAEQESKALCAQIARFNQSAANHEIVSVVVAHMTASGIPETERVQMLKSIMRNASISGNEVLGIFQTVLRSTGKHDIASAIDSMLAKRVLDKELLVRALGKAMTSPPQLPQGGGEWSLAIAAAAPPAPIIPQGHQIVPDEYIQDAMAHMAGLKKQLQDVDFQRMRSEAYATAHAKTIEDRNKELIDAELRASTCERNVAALQHENNMLQNKNATLQAGDTNLRENLAELQHEIDTLRNENATLRNENTALRAGDTNLRNEVADLRKENRELQKRRSPDDDDAVSDERCLKRANASAPAPAPAHASEDSSA
jgi:regulator of replication initiation timing